MTSAARIVVIEDDPAIARLLETSLEAAGYRVQVAGDVAGGLVAAQSWQPELILLDLGLPDGDGLTLIPRLREFTAAPILVLSARGLEEDRVAALDLGADDFVPKPFSAPELHARIRAALRRSRQAAQLEERYQFGDVVVDLAGRTVARGGEEVHLTPTEFKLLVTLIEGRGKVLTQRYLLNAVWGPQLLDQPQYLRVYMKQLRQKLESNPAQPVHFKTETGVGYRFVPSDY
jgi:two-component system KDP operon response regulator KdpE